MIKLNSDSISTVLGLVAAATEILASKGFEPECSLAISAVCLAGLGYITNKGQNK